MNQPPHGHGPPQPGYGPPQQGYGPGPLSGAGYPSGAIEQALYASGPIQVTTARIVLGPTVYPVANITSVSRFTQPRPLRLLVYGGLGAFFFGLGAIGSKNAFAGLLALVCIGLVVLYCLSKPKHWIRLGAAGTERNAFCTHDQSVADQAIGAINHAIIVRSGR